MIEIALKYSALVVIAWGVTRGIRPSNAARARMIWLLTLVSPLAFAFPISSFPISAFPSSSVPVSSFPISAAYALIAAVLLLRVAVNWLRASRIVRAARPIEPAELARLRAIAGVASLRIAESDLPGPVTAGIVRPIVLLPYDWRDVSEGTLGAMLRHEAAHVRRHDPAIALLAGVVQALLWFTPASLLTRREFLRFAESAADADAALDPREYAGVLLGLAAARRMSAGPMLAAGGSESAIARRVRLLLDDVEFGAQGRSRAQAGLVAIVAAAALFAAVRLGASSADAEAGFSAEGVLGAEAGFAVQHAQRHAARHAGH